MKIHSLLAKLAIPFLLITIFFIVTTFLAYFTHGSEWHRVWGINFHRVLELLDLREENTLATWFSSMVFLAVGIGFLLLGWGYSSNYSISRLTRGIFKLATIGAILLSADEVASIHETVGKSFGRFIGKLFVGAPTDDKGFFWVPLFAPIALIGLIAVAIMLHKIIANMPTSRDWQRYSAYLAILIAFMCLPGVFVLELLEWHLSVLNQGVTILTCFEETFEMFGMYSLFFGTMLIARQYQL